MDTGVHQFVLFFKKALTPITIMVIPHGNFKCLKMKIPTIGVFLMLVFAGLGGFYAGSPALAGLEYRAMAEKGE